MLCGRMYSERSDWIQRPAWKPACFANICPSLSDTKNDARKRQCSLCGLGTELVSGICRPCRRARTRDRFEGVNEDKEALACQRCATVRSAQCARRSSLALWCAMWTIAEERCRRLCRRCLDTQEKCGFCQAEIQALSVRVGCERPMCGRVDILCVACAPSPDRTQRHTDIHRQSHTDLCNSFAAHHRIIISLHPGRHRWDHGHSHTDTDRRPQMQKDTARHRQTQTDTARHGKTVTDTDRHRQIPSQQRQSLSFKRASRS